MKKLLFAIIIMFAIGAIACRDRADSPVYLPELVRLDSLIEQKDEFEVEKRSRIDGLRQREQAAVSPADRYMAASLLYDEYSIYDSDSAAAYVDRMLDLARRCGSSEWEIHSLISKANLLAITGMLRESEQIMTSIDPSELSTEQLIEYYAQMIFLYSHLGNYEGGEYNEYYRRERAYKDSIMEYIRPAHPDYLWFRSWDIIGTDKKDPDLIPTLKERVDASDLNTRRDAMEAYVLSKLYETEGDYDNYARYMALSAMADVRIANAEIASLQEIGGYLFDQGDIDRAYRYVNYSLNKAITFPNRVRAIGITKLLDNVNSAYQSDIEAESRRTRTTLIIMCVFAAVLVAAGALNVIQNRRLRRQGRSLDAANKSLKRNMEELSAARDRLDAANAELARTNSELQTANQELNEANYVKEEYVGYVFTICSNYIHKLESLRRSIHVKAVTGKYKDIIKQTESTDMMRDELQEFYRSFDTVFLHIYPDFISDFNSLLQDDKQIVPKEGELLNTELRIYALVRLGITDSVKIAEFLHCSPQTVYNNRFKVRGKARIAKKEFVDAVMTLGKFRNLPS